MHHLKDLQERQLKTITSGKNIIIDIKTSKDASPEGFAREAAQNNYFIQALFQIEGVIRTGHLESVDEYFWLVAEKHAPYNYAAYRFQIADRESFEPCIPFYLQQCAEALDEFKSLGAENFHKVSSYGAASNHSQGIIDIEVPLWYRNRI